MKNLIKIMICFSLIYTPFFSMSANASNVGGWTLSNPIAQGASTVYDATKKIILNGKDFVKTSTVKITPTASQVSKVLARGAAGYALSVAVEQMFGAVDWVLDPANNQIVIKAKPSTCLLNGTDCPYTPMLWSGYAGARFDAILPACQSFVDSYIKSVPTLKPATARFKQISSNTASCSASRIRISDGVQVSDYTIQITASANPAYNPNAEKPQDRVVPLATVASRVISNAESADEAKSKPAQVATTSAAADTVAESEKDDTKARPIVTQAEANSQTSPMDETGTRPQTEAESNIAQGTQTQKPANPAQTDLALEFPVFCSWASTVCEASQVVISFPQTLTGWWDTANHKVDEWVTSISEAYHDFINDDELPNEETKVDITDIPTPELQENAISWGASCPADVSLPISMQGVSSTIVFSWSPWCQLLSIIKPAIVASAYIGAAFIVLGLRT